MVACSLNLSGTASFIEAVQPGKQATPMINIVFFKLSLRCNTLYYNCLTIYRICFLLNIPSFISKGWVIPTKKISILSQPSGVAGRYYYQTILITLNETYENKYHEMGFDRNDLRYYSSFLQKRKK